MNPTSDRTLTVPVPQPKRRRWEAEFLPSALAIMETPASPMPWMASWVVIQIFVLSLIGSYFGHIDIVVVAPGRIEPKGFSRVVQALEIARITSIKVEEGSKVKAGQVLIETDTSEYQADLARANQDHMAATLTLARTEAELAAKPYDMNVVMSSLGDVDSTHLELERQHLISDLTEQWAKLRGIEQQMEEQNHALKSARLVVSTYGALIPALEKRFLSIKVLARKGYASEVQLVEAQQKYADTKFNYDSNRSRIQQLESAIQNLSEKQQQTISEFHNRLQNEAGAARQRLAESEQAQTRATYRLKQAVLRSPVDGMVFQLATTTPGAVVQPGQQIMTIVPIDFELTLEAVLDSKDAGFVKEGQTAEIKIDAFPFTKYGMLQGKVTRLSRNSMPAQAPAQADLSAAQGQAPSDSNVAKRNYTVSISLAHTSLDDHGETVVVTPGMTANAEIKTGERRILEYFLSPFAAKLHEAAHER